MSVDVSIILLTYNPDFKKLLLTLKSAIQNNVNYEIIISDDGSSIPVKKAIDEFFCSHPDIDHTLITSDVNTGTIKNYIRGIEVARGRYIFGISPGDFFYNEYVLSRMYQFMRQNDYTICFGDGAHYRMNDDHAEYLSTINNLPPYADCFNALFPKKLKNIAFMSGNYPILGPTYMREKSYFLYCLKKAESFATYVEDYSCLLIAASDMVNIVHFPETVVWYEHGTGVSTSSKMKNAISNDIVNSYKYISDYNEFGNLSYKLKYSNNKFKYIKMMIAHPVFMLYKLVFKIICLMHSNYSIHADERELNRIIKNQ